MLLTIEKIKNKNLKVFFNFLKFSSVCLTIIFALKNSHLKIIKIVVFQKKSLFSQNLLKYILFKLDIKKKTKLFFEKKKTF